MPPLRIQFAAVDAPETRLDRAIEWLLIGLIAFCPLSFGAVNAWSEGVFLLIASAIVLCFAAKLVLRPDARFVWSWSYLPIALFLLLVAIQLLPLPSGFVHTIASNTVETKTRALAGLPGADEATHWATLSFYREPTLRQLSLVAALGAIFIVVVNVFQTVDSIRRLLIAMTLVGLGEAALALAQDLTQSDSIYWSIPVYEGHARAGSFVNHSHFGQFMNLSIGAAIALVLFEWHLHSRHNQEDPWREKFELDDIATFSQRAPMYLGIATIVACAIALVLSLTRGGVVSMLVAGALAMLLLCIKSPSSRKMLAVASLLLALIVLVIAWVGLDPVLHRLASTAEVSASNLRGQTLRDLRAAWRQFPLFGTGLGTYAYVFPMFDHSKNAAVATHAENEYAQTLTETGAIGLALALGFIVLIWLSFVRAIRGRFSSISAIAIGLGYGFAAILVHSFADFGQHIPANALLTTVSCGLLVSLARQRRLHHRHSQALQDFHGSLICRIVAGIGVLVLSALALVQLLQMSRAERAFQASRRVEDRLQKAEWNGTNDDFADLILAAQNASDLRPGNVEYASWLAIDRWRWVSAQPDAITSERNLDFARRIADELNRARMICPTYWLPVSMAGQIEFFVLHDSRGADDIRMGSQLNQNDPTAVFAAGRLAASQGDWELSLQDLRHYAQIAPSNDVVDLYVNEFDRADRALQVAHGDLRGLNHLAELLTQKGSDEPTLESARQEAGDLQLQMANRPDAGPGTLVVASQIAIVREDHLAAIGYLRRTLSTETSRWDLRLELARQLGAAGKTSEAITEAGRVLRHDPDSRDARAVIQDLQK